MRGFYGFRMALLRRTPHLSNQAPTHRVTYVLVLPTSRHTPINPPGSGKQLAIPGWCYLGNWQQGPPVEGFSFKRYKTAEASRRLLNGQKLGKTGCEKYPLSSPDLWLFTKSQRRVKPTPRSMQSLKSGGFHCFHWLFGYRNTNRFDKTVRRNRRS